MHIAHAAGDQLTVLRSEIDDDDQLIGWGDGHGCSFDKSRSLALYGTGPVILDEKTNSNRIVHERAPTSVDSNRMRTPFARNANPFAHGSALATAMDASPSPKACLCKWAML